MNLKAFDINDINGLLIIDWWKETDSKKNWTSAVTSNLDKLKFETVVISNYEIQPSLEDPCQLNTVMQYGWYDYQPKILAPLLKECRPQRTSNPYIVQNYSVNGFVILDIESLLLHFEQSQISIKNWLVVGGGWQDCCHHRPIGFKNLIRLPFNFFVANWSIHKPDNSFLTPDDFAKDNLPWTHVGNDLYKLGNVDEQTWTQ